MLQKKVQRGNYCRKCVKKKCKRKSTKKACFSLDLLWTCILVLKKSRIWQWLNYRKMWNLKFPILSNNSLVGQLLQSRYSTAVSQPSLNYILLTESNSKSREVLEVFFVYLLLFCYLMFLTSLYVFASLQKSLYWMSALTRQTDVLEQKQTYHSVLELI